MEEPTKKGKCFGVKAIFNRYNSQEKLSVYFGEDELFITQVALKAIIGGDYVPPSLNRVTGIVVDGFKKWAGKSVPPRLRVLYSINFTLIDFVGRYDQGLEADLKKLIDQ
jgi:hypothetical protein